MWVFDFLTVVIKSVRRVNTRALLGVVGVFCDWLLLHPTILAPPLNDLPQAEVCPFALCSLVCLFVGSFDAAHTCARLCRVVLCCALVCI
jgi:hypothetical protein